ncbi:hypothetical protein SE17_14920, partial [Kouleothrix aurantiaca]
MIQKFRHIPGTRQLRDALRYAQFVRQFRAFQRRTPAGRPRPVWAEHQAHLRDSTANTPFDRHYTYHPAWAARVL